MWEAITNIASVFTIVSAIVTFLSALSIRNYYDKIVLQYSIEKLTVAEQHVQNLKTLYNQVKRLYKASSRGVTKSKLSNLYMDIDENLDQIIYSIPSSYIDITDLVNKVREQLNIAMSESQIMTESESFYELGILIDNLYAGVKIEKERGQNESMESK